MDKLYPPIIGDKIQGFVKPPQGNITISVPFENNRSVAQSEVEGIVLRLKTIQTDSLSITKQGTIDWVNKKANFSFSLTEKEEIKLNYGQFYKLQIAYIRVDPNSEDPVSWEQRVGYYSNVGISKCTSEPTVEIADSPTTHIYSYVGLYSQKVNNTINDVTEKVYQYKFTITQGNIVVADSGWLTHDSATDENEYSSYDIWEYLKELPEGEYKIRYHILTNSGILIDSPKYTITSSGEVQSGITLIPKLDFDNGYIDIFVETTTSYTGVPYVIRKNKETGEIINLGPAADTLSVDNKVFRDFTFEQGYHYSYAIWTKSDNAYTRYQYCDPIYADFEDMFLYDGERQLKLRFNPSVSGIHYTILESKQDTIGGKYPIFFRNGNVKYRDFTINGLISFQMDEQRLFSEYGVADQPSRERTYTTGMDDSNPPKLHSFVIPTDLVGENFFHERMFREEVLEWLNDGRVKLFRSPSEGNLIIKIMNVNMTPEQVPSRMIYNVSCQAYEAMGHEYKDLVKAKIIERD